MTKAHETKALTKNPHRQMLTRKILTPITAHMERSPHGHIPTGTKAHTDKYPHAHLLTCINAHIHNTTKKMEVIIPSEMLVMK
jgi:hypothetical protein